MNLPERIGRKSWFCVFNHESQYSATFLEVPNKNGGRHCCSLACVTVRIHKPSCANWWWKSHYHVKIFVRGPVLLLSLEHWAPQKIKDATDSNWAIILPPLLCHQSKCGFERASEVENNIQKVRIDALGI